MDDVRIKARGPELPWSSAALTSDNDARRTFAGVLIVAASLATADAFAACSAFNLASSSAFFLLAFEDAFSA